MSVREKQQETAQAFLNGRRQRTSEGAVLRRSADCIHRTIPRSLGLETSNNEQYAEQWKQVMGMMRKSNVTIKKIVNDPEAHTVVIHSDVKADTVVGPYEGETIFFLSTNEDGDEIVAIEEFVDSAMVTDWWPKVLVHSALNK